jgi:putative spermidine/putrescine transport system permease protein
MSKPIKYLLAGILCFPFVFLLILSVGRHWPYPALFPQEWTLSNWKSLLSGQSGMGYSLVLSLALSLSVAAIATISSFFLSRQIAYHPRREAWLSIAYLPYVFAPVILAACLQFFFIIAGLYGKPAGVLIAQLLITIPYGIIFFVGFWNERMLAMEQLVYTLGGNSSQAYAKVLLPAARGALLTCFFQLFLISWFEYGLTNLIGVGKVSTLTLKVFQYVNEANLFLAALASCLLVLPPVVLLWLNKNYLFSQEKPG